MPSYELPEGVERFDPRPARLGAPSNIAPHPNGAYIRVSDLDTIRSQEHQRVREQVRGALGTHWLAQIECDHDAEQDRPVCGCSEVDLGWHPSIGVALDIWIDHFLAHLDSLEDGDGEQCKPCEGTGRRLVVGRVGISEPCPRCTGTGEKPDSIEDQIGDALLDQANALALEHEDA
jgi:hypothetical protein